MDKFMNISIDISMDIHIHGTPVNYASKMYKTHLITQYYVASILVKGKYYRPLSNLEKSSDWNNFWHKNTLLQNKQNGIVCIPICRKNFFHHTYVNHPTDNGAKLH